MLEKVTRLFQGNELAQMSEVDSYNLPGHVEIGNRIIEAAKDGRYYLVIPLNDDFFRHSAWFVEEHYRKYSLKYQSLSKILEQYGYSHQIIEPDKNDFHTGLHLYISWNLPDVPTKLGFEIIGALDAKRISDQHIENKIDYIKLEKIMIKIVESRIGDFPVEIPDELNQNEFSLLFNQLESKGYTCDVGNSKIYNKYVVKVKL